MAFVNISIVRVRIVSLGMPVSIAVLLEELKCWASIIPATQMTSYHLRFAFFLFGDSYVWVFSTFEGNSYELGIWDISRHIIGPNEVVPVDSCCPSLPDFYKFTFSVQKSGEALIQGYKPLLLLFDESCKLLLCFIDALS